jgi:sirohydrochlorin ferrochelatase
MNDSPPRLLLVAHGTRSAAGSHTTARIAAAVAAARPQLQVNLCFLDVAEPTLSQALERLDGQPTVLVPMLLSTGYHVQQDIPAAVAERRDVLMARHLGPHALLTRALLDRLRAAGGAAGRRTVLVGAGSSRPEAAAELAEAGRLLAAELGAEVVVRTIGELSSFEPPTADPASPEQVATYLLAEGQFTDTLRATYPAAPVAAPIGTHPALIDLVLARFDETAHAGS